MKINPKQSEGEKSINTLLELTRTNYCECGNIIKSDEMDVCEECR